MSKQYIVEVPAIGGWTTHSTHESFRSAADQSDMVHGRVAGEKAAHSWANSEQGFGGTFDEWMSQDDGERAAYELGAAGIPTA